MIRAVGEESASTAGRAARERTLLERHHKHGDTAARDQLAEEMLPLARALAGRYAGRGEPLDDLVQVACIGIMKAIDGFDLSRDVRFSSYATPTVLGEIKRHFRDRTWALHVPRGTQELQLKVEKVGANLEDVLDALQSAQAHRTRSFDEPAGEDSTLAESLGTADPELGRAEIRVLLDDAFDVLSERDREILRLRFEEDMTQTEISDRIGVSQMQVSRLIRQALARLRMDIESNRRGQRRISAA